MAYLKSANARQIAEARWGRGGTHAYKTNRRGAYYFSCAGHGGFVIAADALTQEEYDAISQYVEPMTATVYARNDNDKVLLYWHPFRVNTGKIRNYGAAGYKMVEEEFFLLEEDCDWALAVKFADIRVEGMTKELAEKTFYNWYDESNPVVRARKVEQEARQNKDPDLIVSALSVDNGLVKVWTADENQYLVRGYDKARDEFNTPWLSRCEEVVERLAA